MFLIMVVIRENYGYNFYYAISFILIFILFLDLEYSSERDGDLKQISVEQNKLITEECGIDGYPVGSIEYMWYNPKGEVVETSKDLIQKLSQFGNYRCTASNRHVIGAPLNYVLEVKEDRLKP